MTGQLPEPEAAPPVTTGEELADLLSEQHADVREAWSRVSHLHACAREDVFLHARRRLAVHLGLERAVLGPRLRQADGAVGLEPHLGADLDEHVVAAERVAGAEGGTESPEFEAACERVAAAFLRHAEAQERVAMTGPLPEADREAVHNAVALWHGVGDVYLGNTWAEMLEVTTDQLASAGHAQDHRALDLGGASRAT
jgi:hypothetical protein